MQNFISSDGCEGVYKGCNKMAKHLQELYEEVKMTTDNWDVENACELLKVIGCKRTNKNH